MTIFSTHSRFWVCNVRLSLQWMLSTQCPIYYYVCNVHLHEQWTPGALCTQEEQSHKWQLPKPIVTRTNSSSLGGLARPSLTCWNVVMQCDTSQPAYSEKHTDTHTHACTHTHTHCHIRSVVQIHHRIQTQTTTTRPLSVSLWPTLHMPWHQVSGTN